MTQNLTNWTVMTDDFFTQGCPESAAAHLANHIEDAIRQEGQEQHFSVVKILPEGSVIVRCDADFGSRLGNLPTARYAVPAAAERVVVNTPDNAMPVLRVPAASAKPSFKPK